MNRKRSTFFAFILALPPWGCTPDDGPRDQAADSSTMPAVAADTPADTAKMDSQDASTSSPAIDNTTQPGAAPANSLDDMLLFFPAKFPNGHWEPSKLKFEDVWITVSENTRIHAWYCPAKQPRAYVLFAHGNAGNISFRSSLLSHLQSMGMTTLAFDYRGYGRSDGIPSKDNIISDAAAARSQLATLAHIQESDVVLMGRPLGGAVVIQLAAQNPPRGLIVESSFSSLADVASHHYPNLAWLVNPNKLNSAAQLPKYRGPLLQSHGTADKTIPVAFAKKLFAAANEPKQFVTIPQGRHNSPQTSQYYAAFNKFIDSL